MNKRLSLIAAFCCMLATHLAAQNAWSLPRYEKHVLRNGLTLYLMEQHEVPLVSLAWVSPAGTAAESDKSGVASLTAQGLGWGSEHFTRDQIDALLDSLGASMDRYAGVDRAGFTCQFASKDHAIVWKAVSEMILSPSFPEKELTKEQNRLSQDLVSMKESPRTVMDNYWRGWMYAGHPYGNPSSGTESSVKSITRGDIQSFFANHYTAAGSALVVVGDFVAKDLKKQLEGTFGTWKSSKPSPSNIKAPELKFTKSRVLLVNKSDSRETRFMIGGKGVPRNHPDYAAIQVVNTILGGRFTSWLNTALRINSGLSYGARSGFSTDRLAGTFAMSSFTATETTEKAIDLALEVLDSLHAHGPDAATLSSAKNYLLGGFAPDFETSQQLADLLSDFHVHGIDEMSINSFSAQVEAVTVAQIRQTIQNHFPRQNLQFVVIGKGSEIRKMLEKYGPVTEKEITAIGY